MSTNKPKKKIYPLVKNACAEKRIHTQKMIQEISNDTGLLKGTISQQYRGWKPLEPRIAIELSKYTGLSVEELMKASLEDDKQDNIPIPDYIVWHLKDLPNCAVSTELVESYESVADFKKAVELATGKQIIVKKFVVNKQEKAPYTDKMFHHGEYEVHYIIEKKREIKK